MTKSQVVDVRKKEARRCANDVCSLCAAGEPLNSLTEHAVTKDNVKWEVKPCAAKKIHLRLAAEGIFIG